MCISFVFVGVVLAQTERMNIPIGNVIAIVESHLLPNVIGQIIGVIFSLSPLLKLSGYSHLPEHR